MVWRQISGPGQVIARLRVGALALIALIIAALVFLEVAAWRLWLFVAVGAVVAAILVVDFIRLRDQQLTQREVPYLLAPIVALHTAIIVISGGAHSPFLVLYVVVGMAPAMTIGRLKPFLAMASVPMGLLWLLSIGAGLGALPALIPTFFSGASAIGRNALFIYTQAVVFTMATMVGGAVILAIRAAVERSTRTAATMRHELVHTMRERNRELVMLSGELAHELKNPLASIQGLSSLVERKLDPDSKEREHMQVLIGEVKRMGATLDEFLNFSRPVTGLSARAVTAAKLMAEVVQLHQGIAAKRNVTLSLVTVAAEPIVCDPRKAKQVLVNLVQNALEAAPAGSRIEARTEPESSGGALFIIQDEGPGIAAKVRGRLFEPGITTRQDGSGLGLTIARAIAEQHGGTLELQEPSAGGCRAVLQLPSQPAPTDPPLSRGGADSPQQDELQS